MFFSLFVVTYVFLFGLAVGSFLNVVVYRLNHNRNPLKGRSFCPKCKHRLIWADNIPVLSFFLLSRKCRYCHSPISWQYPLVEVATAFLSVLVYCWSIANFQILPFTIYYLLITYCLIAIFTSDLLYQTIPDEISYPGIIISFFFLMFSHQYQSILVGIFAAAFFLSLNLLTHGKGMAIGDVKLAFLLGLFLGWPKIIVCLYLAFLTGAFVGVILILTKRHQFGRPIAFGPFLVGSTLTAVFFGEKIISYLDRFF